MTKGNKYTPPKRDSEGFHCPHCGVYAHQRWFDAFIARGGYEYIERLKINICAKCKEYCVWYGDKMIYPVASSAPMPSPDTPEDVKEDFLEARNIVDLSPRASTALLRLALQKLMPHLDESGKDLNGNIANLVKKGLPKRIQEALDGVRVIGNNAVHPGNINLKDDITTAVTLFELLNMIVDVMIAQPKKVDEIYKKIPQGAKEAIEKRDSKKNLIMK